MACFVLNPADTLPTLAPFSLTLEFSPDRGVSILPSWNPGGGLALSSPLMYVRARGIAPSTWKMPRNSVRNTPLRQHSVPW